MAVSQKIFSVPDYHPRSVWPFDPLLCVQQEEGEINTTPKMSACSTPGECQSVTTRAAAAGFNMHLPNTGGEDPSQPPTLTAEQLQFSGASLLFIKLDAGLTLVVINVVWLSYCLLCVCFLQTCPGSHGKEQTPWTVANLPSSAGKGSPPPTLSTLVTLHLKWPELGFF